MLIYPVVRYSTKFNTTVSYNLVTFYSDQVRYLKLSTAAMTGRNSS